MRSPLLYKELACYYDSIYSYKDYQKETIKVRNLIKQYRQTDGNELLEAACGTGGHARYLKDHFQYIGFDRSDEMLKIARKKVPGVKFLKEDLVSFNLHKKFDVILCLFSSISYLRTYPNLNKALRNFAAHLKNGGVVIIEPFFDKNTYKKGTVWMNTCEDAKTKVVRQVVLKAKGNISVLEMHYLVGKKNQGIKYFKDIHEAAMFDHSKFLQLMKNNGFRAKFLRDGLIKGRGLFVGIKE